MKTSTQGLQIDLFSDAQVVQEKLDSVKKKKNIAWLETADLRLVNDEAELRALVSEALSAVGPKAVDTETTGLTKDDKLVGVSVAWKKVDGTYISFYVPLYSEISQVSIEPFKTLTILKPLLEQPCVWYNFKFDYKALKNVGIESGLLADVSVMELFPKDNLDQRVFDHLINSGLKVRFKEKFDLDMLELSDVLGKGQYDFSLAPLELARSYAAVDSYATLALYYYYLPLTKVDDIIYDMEHKVLPVVADMEYTGILLDSERLKQVRAEVFEETRALEAKVYELAGRKFAIGSGAEIAGLLYGDLKLPVMKYIKGKDGKPTEKPSTDKDALKRLKGKHAIIEPLAEYKSNHTLLSSFLDKLPKLALSDGRIHTNYRPYGTISGRFTSNNPNLQQIPKSGDEDSNKAYIRKCFVSAPGCYLLDVDYSQVEYRILASLSRDPALIKAFEDDSTDFHQSTASLMFGIPYDKVTSDERKKGKILNFGLAYGLSAGSLANVLGVSEDEANELYRLYFEKMPTTQLWIERTHEEIIRQKFSVSFYGRVRNLPDAGSLVKKERFAALREGLNHRIQATSAEITKIAMVRCARAVKPLGISILLQVHDELLFEVPDSIPPEQAVAVVRKAMELPMEAQGFVKLKAEASIGRTWGDCVDFHEGMSLADIPRGGSVGGKGLPSEVTFFLETQENLTKLKDLFSQHPGSVKVFLNAGGSVIVPQAPDQETGEYVDVCVMASEEFLKIISDLGIKYQTSV
jgi:DNA polymerase-1